MQESIVSSMGKTAKSVVKDMQEIDKLGIPVSNKAYLMAGLLKDDSFPDLKIFEITEMIRSIHP